MEVPQKHAEKQPITIGDLFLDLTEDQLKEVEETFHGYLNALWRIYVRLKRERPEIFDSLKRTSYD